MVLVSFGSVNVKNLRYVNIFPDAFWSLSLSQLYASELEPLVANR